MTTALIEAARAVVERWELPVWKDAPATAVYIAALRTALAAADAQPVGEPVPSYLHAGNGGAAFPASIVAGWPEHNRRNFTHALYAAPQPVGEPAPAGWKLVPEVPTEEMAKAGCYRMCRAFVEDYQAMLAASPAAPAQEPHAEIARLHAEDRRRILGLLEELRDANCAAQGVEYFQLLTPRQEKACGALRSALTGRNMTHDQAALNSPAAEIQALKDLLREATVALLWPGPPAPEFIDRLNAAIDGPNA